MSIVVQDDRSVHASQSPLSAYSIVRDAPLPLGCSIFIQVEALRSHYARQTGRVLDLGEAIRCLDRLHAERDDVPFPAAYARIADLLVRLEYNTDAIHAIIGHLVRHRTTNYCPHIHLEDRAAVENLMPHAGRRSLGVGAAGAASVGAHRGSWGRDEDEDESFDVY